MPRRCVSRLRKADDEEPIGLTLADHVVVNDDLETTIDEMLAIIEAAGRGGDPSLAGSICSAVRPPGRAGGADLDMEK